MRKSYAGLLIALILVSISALLVWRNRDAGPIRTDTTITVTAGGGDCSKVGIWDEATYACMLTKDIIADAVDAIRISGDNITLDGNNHKLVCESAGASFLYGVVAEGQSNIVVQNLEVEGFRGGINITGPGSGSELANNDLHGNDYGICISVAGKNHLAGNTITDNKAGGIRITGSNENMLTGNVISVNAEGILLESGSSNNSIYGNDFLDNTVQAVAEGSGNTFFLELPEGGNFWSDWDPGDADGDGIGDSPYAFDGGRDELPLAAPVPKVRFKTGAPVYFSAEGVTKPPLGTNILLNPRFTRDEEGGNPYGWEALGAPELIQLQAVPQGAPGPMALRLKAGGGSGVKLRAGTGFTDKGKGYYHFSVWMKTAGGPEESVTINSGAYRADGEAEDFSSTDLQIGAAWKRYDIQGQLSDDESTLEFQIQPAAGGGYADIWIGGGVIEYYGSGRYMDSDLTYPVDFYDGDTAGCFWKGEPGMSESVRRWGALNISNELLGLDYDQPFWFIIDTSMGFGSNETLPHSLYLTIFHEFDGIDASKNGEAYAFHYTDEDLDGNFSPRFLWVRYTNDDACGSSSCYNMVVVPAKFARGDQLTAVCSWDRDHGMRLWAKTGEDDILYAEDTTATRNLPLRDFSSWEIMLDDGHRGLHKYEDEAAEYSRHTNGRPIRYFSVGQGTITDRQARDMIETGSTGAATSGFYFPFAESGTALGYALPE